MSILKITTFQTYLFWENIDKNLQNLSLRLTSIRETTDLIVLPEMFSTGFSMNPEKLAEKMNGKTMKWMLEQAKKYKCVITGSIIIKEKNKNYNRLIWMRPNGTFEYYDKRHLFGLGEEDQHYTAGSKKLFVELKGWKICPVICYDLRFPIWLRNTNEEYDMLLIVANWPERRSLHWRSLIPARAIENQAFVVAVNRVGHDGNEVYHSGDSMCIDPNGKVIYYKPNDEDLYTFTINKNDVTEARSSFPFLKDGDSFTLTDQ